ncbi:MAG TPA: hypothetical protein VM935_15155 [Chitinophagaceae bacterium]|nr:hypothetical protein [Chitinophagaceae bacterium]
MKQAFLICLFSITAHFCFAQSPYNEIALEQKEDYKKAEKDILKAAGYLFNSPYDKDDLERLYAIEFIMKWMSGTPDYKFELNEKYSKPFSSETDLIGLYMAAMAKYAVENREKKIDPDNISLAAVKIILDYSNKPSNNLKQTGELKKMNAALKKGELQKYFGS